MTSRLNALHTLPAQIAPASGFWARGKSLVKLYKAGIVNVWHNRTKINKIREAHGCRNGMHLAKIVVENTHLKHIEQQIKKGKSAPLVLKREELLTLIRTERDLRKLPSFVVVFAICFEFTPLVLWAFPRIAPSTCWSESYNEKLRKTYKTCVENLKVSSNFDGSESPYRLETPILRKIGATLDFGLHYQFLPRSLLISRLLDHMTVIRADDVLLRESEAHLNELEEEELIRALMARALPLNGGLNALRTWLHEFKEPMDAGYFLKSKREHPKT